MRRSISSLSTWTVLLRLSSGCLIMPHHNQRRQSPRLSLLKRTITTKAASSSAFPPPPSRKRKVRPSTELSSPTRNGTTSTATSTSAVAVVSPDGGGTTQQQKSAGVLTSTEIALVNPITSSSFEDLCVPPEELRPSTTLTTGQCFHWRAGKTSCSTVSRDDVVDFGSNKESAWGSHNATEWLGVLRCYNNNNNLDSKESDGDSSIVLSVRETPETTLYRVLHAPLTFSRSDIQSFLQSYFRLNENGPSLNSLYQEWSNSCTRLERIASCIPGVRIVDQDPWECLISFICSSNNNIPRITKMINSIRQVYGKELLSIGQETLYSFPSLQVLKERATEKDLRNLCGLGYRAKYVMDTIHTLDSLGGEDYLHQLKKGLPPVTTTTTVTVIVDVRKKLLQFAGVGPKVADCVALFSLKQDDTIPVDVHVLNIAKRDYDDEGHLSAALSSSSSSSLTPTTYKLVGDLFRSRFPQKSGWAHSLLFVAELPSFRPALPEDLVQEMDAFRVEEKAKKGVERKKKQKRTQG